MRPWFLVAVVVLWATLVAGVPVQRTHREAPEARGLLGAVSSLGKTASKLFGKGGSKAKTDPKPPPPPPPPPPAAAPAPAPAPAPAKPADKPAAAGPGKSAAPNPSAAPAKSAAPNQSAQPKVSSKPTNSATSKSASSKTSSSPATSSTGRSALAKLAWPIQNIAGAKPPPTLAQAKAKGTVQGTDVAPGDDPALGTLNLPPEMQRRDGSEADRLEDEDDEVFLRSLGIDPDTIIDLAPASSHPLEARLAADGCPDSATDFTGDRTKPIPLNSAMFYSGVHFREATKFARKRKLTPIFRFVDFDKFPKDAQKICPGFWNFASQAFAEQCAGRATAVMPPLPAGFNDVQAAPFQGINLKSVWADIEWKALQLNPLVREVVRTDVSGNTFELLKR